ncbi:uncharacterized protein LOC135848218 [Planococcus citri]|uniref:uncharacterized protein LOC135848218 n=1 Tax=Planococcus citri TaxID=170843 RepID=UPI0031F8B46F
MSPYFSMHLKWIIFASLLIFVIIEETTSDEALLLQKDNPGMPLAVIVTKEGDSSRTKLRLATPREYEQDRDYVVYHYNDSNDLDAPEEKFMLACPPYYLEVEQQWLQHDATSSESRLFTLIEYTSDRRDSECKERMIPSIKKIQKEENESKRKHCTRSESQAEMYEVGYPVLSNNAGTVQDIQFLPVYKICHLSAKGKGATLYSIHRIEAPSLLFQREIKELPELYPWSDNLVSYLDENLKTIKPLKYQINEYYAYQFVETDDMPIRSWERTTKFLFNYTPITKNEDLFKGVIRADFFIRLYSKKNDKQLTLYSGTHQTRIANDTGPVGCFKKLCGFTILIESFWRIIKDDSGKAIILVTQHTQRECGEDEEYLCEANRKMKKYENGGCTYTCSMHDPVHNPTLDLLNLPDIEINGNLDFTFEINETETNSRDGQGSSGTKSSKKIDIIDFLNEKSFMDTVRKIDEKIAGNISFQPA